MIIGRREDFIEKIQRACAAWKRQDAQLAVTAGEHSIFITALYVHLECIDCEPDGSEQSYEDYPDAVFVSLSEAVGNRDTELKRGILAYFEEHSPRAKATAERQLKLEFS